MKGMPQLRFSLPGRLWFVLSSQKLTSAVWKAERESAPLWTCLVLWMWTCSLLSWIGKLILTSSSPHPHLILELWKGIRRFSPFLGCLLAKSTAFWASCSCCTGKARHDQDTKMFCQAWLVWDAAEAVLALGHSVFGTLPPCWLSIWSEAEAPWGGKRGEKEEPCTWTPASWRCGAWCWWPICPWGSRLCEPPRA